MRKRFEQQKSIGRLLVEDTLINIKNRSALTKLLLALKYLYTNSEYNNKIFNILEDTITKNKKATGRKGMDLWHIFVLAQVRLCEGLSYDTLHDWANNHKTLRQIMGVESDYGFVQEEFEYQNIVDNVKLLDDDTLSSLNQVIVEMGHDVFKKKETEVLRLKTDSYVVESNVHFPTDYNLLYDCGRKCLDTIVKLIKNKDLKGWRKLAHWRIELKKLMRNLGQSTKGGGKNKETRIKDAAKAYLTKARLLVEKIKAQQCELPLENEKDLALQIVLEEYLALLKKHIDLVDRRILQGQTIPHCEKMFSIFEQYTEWLTKGKQNPSVELGKNLQITSDQYHLVIDYQIMEEKTDKEAVIELADRVLNKYKVKSWSWDKGYYTKLNKELLSLEINELIMPKRGKLNEEEKEQEHARPFKKLRNKHSAIESNINELNHRGLSRCPDRGYQHFKNYIGLGICAYNLHKIGAELLRQIKAKVEPVLQKAA